MKDLNLYFVPILCRALEDPNPRLALKTAFHRIAELGGQPDYAVGYRQFLRFMAEVWNPYRR